MSLYEVQNKIGKASAKINLIGAYIFGGILIFAGLSVIIWNLLIRNCNTNEEEDFFDLSAELCKEEKIQNTIIGIVFILLAIGLVLFSRWWVKKTHEDDGFAQVAALTTEANIMKSIFND